MFELGVAADLISRECIYLVVIIIIIIYHCVNIVPLYKYAIHLYIYKVVDITPEFWLSQIYLSIHKIENATSKTSNVYVRYGIIRDPDQSTPMIRIMIDNCKYLHFNNRAWCKSRQEAEFETENK